MHVRIESKPPRNFYLKSADGITAGEAKHRILVSLSELRSTAGSENANIGVVLENRSGESSSLFYVPPVGLPASVRDAAGTTIFAGTVASVSLTSEVCDLSIEA
jgi:hypothetical protein